MSTVTQSRRACLGALASIPALAIPAAVTAEPTDPILALIARHKLARARFSETCNLTDEVRAREEGREVTAADDRAYETTSDAEQAAMRELKDTPPLTAAGAVAVLHYLVELNDRGWGPEITPYFATLLRSPIMGRRHEEEIANV